MQSYTASNRADRRKVAILLGRLTEGTDGRIRTTNSFSDMGRVPTDMERHPKCHGHPTSNYHMLFQSSASFCNGLTRDYMGNLLSTQALGFGSLYFTHLAECSPVVCCQTSCRILAKPRESLADKSKTSGIEGWANHFTRMRFPVLGLVP